MAPEMRPHDDGKANENTVFIDTSLDTHLATTFSDSDTVSDLKKKIVLEHRQCFPAIGDIKILGLKVKRRGNFYHLSDSMLVKSVFGATTRNWFVSVDACCLEQHGDIQNFDKHKAGDQLALCWSTHSQSIDKHDSHADIPSKLPLVLQSPLAHPKIVPFVQKVSTVDQFASGDSCKDASVNIEEDKPSNDDRWKNPQLDLEKQLDSKEHSEKQLDSKEQEKLYLVNKEIKSKKRIRNVHNESSIEDALGSGPSMKKKRKTKKGNVKATGENRVLTHVFDKVQYTGASINDENSLPIGKATTLDGVVTKASNDEPRTMSVSQKMNIINEGENYSALDQAAIVVPCSAEDVGVETHLQKHLAASETVSDVSVVLEKNIPQEMPLGVSQEQENDLLSKAGIENEILSSPMRTADNEREAPGLTAVGHPKGGQRSTKNKATEKEESSTSLIKKVHNMTKDASDSVQRDAGSADQEFAGDRTDKHKEEMGSAVNQGPEVKVPEWSTETMRCEDYGGGKRRKRKKSSAKNKDESQVKHADNVAGDISSQVPAPVFDGKIIDERQSDKFEVLDKVSEPDESHRSEVHVGGVEEKSRRESKNRVGSKRKKKDAGRSAVGNNESVAKHIDDAATGTNKENLLPHSERKESLETTTEDALCVNRGRSDDNPMDNDIENSRTKKSRSQVNAEGIIDNSKKENEKMSGTEKSKKKKKSKKSATRNEDESIMKHADGNNCGMSTAVSDQTLHGQLHENTKEGESCLPDADRKNVLNEMLADAVAVGTDGDRVEGKDAEFLQVNEANRSEDGIDGKSKNKLNSTSQTPSFVPVEEQPSKLDKARDAPSLDERSVRKTKNNHKSSVRGCSDLPNKHQSTELELEADQSKDIEHHPFLEETSKNVVVSEVPKVRIEGKDDVNSEVDIAKEGSHEIDFMDYFLPGHQPKKIASTDNVKDATPPGREKKPKKKSLVSNGNDGPIQSQKPLSKNEKKSLFSSKKTSEVSTDMVKDPNIDQTKTPKKTSKVDAPRPSKSGHPNKGQDVSSAESSSSSETFGRPSHNHMSNKQQSTLGKTQVKTLKKNAPVVNSSQHVKGLLNTPGTIFWDDSDGSSDSSTRTPSAKSSSSDSGESASSVDSRRNGSRAIKRKESGGKNKANSQSKISMAELLRSSSRFKKAKLNASQQEDTESQPVDFVPESQPGA